MSNDNYQLDWAEIQKKFKEIQESQKVDYNYYHPYPQPCPSCGRCPTCGRNGWYQQPHITYTTY